MDASWAITGSAKARLNAKALIVFIVIGFLFFERKQIMGQG
jgi:hypothetical protein